MLGEISRKLSVTQRATDTFQKFHFAFIFHFPSGTDFQLIYRGGRGLNIGGPDVGGPDVGGPDIGGPDIGGRVEMSGPDIGGPDVGVQISGVQDLGGPDVGVQMSENNSIHVHQTKLHIEVFELSKH